MSNETTSSNSDCAFQSVERRLEDASTLWRKAQDAYFSPDDFRVNLQACIQAFRSVTWVLQNVKNQVQGFDQWYPTWQEKMREDRILRWLVEARNRIEKQGDLETSSTLKVTFSAGWADAPAIEHRLPASTRPEQFARYMASRFPRSQMTDDSVLKVERRWVDSELPESEILDALCHCHRWLSRIVSDAHERFTKEISKCAFARKMKSTNFELPDSMLSSNNSRVSWLKIKTGQSISIGTEFRTFSMSESTPMVKERYGLDESLLKGLEEADDFRAQCIAWFRIAKRYLEVDGFAIPTAFLRTEKTVHIFQLGMADRAEKHIVIRDLADTAKRLNAVSVVLINEAWVAQVTPNSPLRHAVDFPDRREAVVLHGLTREGRAVDCFAFFHKRGGKIVFEKEQIIEGSPPNILEPFFGLWNIVK